MCTYLYILQKVPRHVARNALQLIIVLILQNAPQDIDPLCAYLAGSQVLVHPHSKVLGACGPAINIYDNGSRHCACTHTGDLQTCERISVVAGKKAVVPDNIIQRSAYIYVCVCVCV